jgi:hypothetical protein
MKSRNEVHTYFFSGHLVELEILKSPTNGQIDGFFVLFKCIFTYFWGLDKPPWCKSHSIIDLLSLFTFSLEIGSVFFMFSDGTWFPHLITVKVNHRMHD